MVQIFAIVFYLVASQWSYAQVPNEIHRNNVVIDVTQAELGPTPSAEVIARARKAYFRGDIVRIVGGTAEDMKRLLGINVATSEPENEANSPAVIAVQKVERSMRQYHAPLKGPTALGVPAWQQAFEKWKDDQNTPAADMGDPAPPSQAWTLIHQNTYAGTSNYLSGSTSYTISVYRLNSNQTVYDYYMVLQNSNVQPNYLPPCYAVLIGSCGWWTDFRSFNISAGANSTLLDHGPTGTITSDTAGFSIGASLGLSGPGVSAGYSATWSQPSVTTTDHSDGITAAWQEQFTPRITVNPPPGTSSGSFLSRQGAIFQVPFRQSFSLNLINSARFVFLDAWGGNAHGPDTNSLNVTIPISPPILSMSPTSLTIAPGQARAVNITATIPNSYQGLSWQLTAQPASGITLSETTGTDNKSVALTIEPGQSIGTIWNLNLQTNPPYGAPSVALNPINLKVTAASPPPLPVQGILLAGGETNGTPSNAVDLYDTANNSIVPLGVLATGRYEHTATVLSDGKVLVAGGQVSDSDGGPMTATAESFDANTRLFTPVQGATTCPGAVGCMITRRAGHTATLLPDGRVLIAGGVTAPPSPLPVVRVTATAELYDPVTQTFTSTGSMATPRASHSAKWIPEQKKVLISGGFNLISQNGVALNSSEYFDPATGQFSSGPQLPVYTGAATTVDSGPCYFCLVGGSNPTKNQFSTFSAQASTWSAAPGLNTARYGATATALGSSELLVAGGSSVLSAGKFPVLATAETNTLSQNGWGNWTFVGTSNASNCPGAVGCMITERVNHTASVLPDGRVLLSGGFDNSGNSLGTTEIFDPTSKTFSSGPALSIGRGLHTATPFRATNLTTQTTIDSSQNPSIYGQAVTYTATVTAPSGGTPDGSVTFKDGSTTLGCVQLTGGSATFKAPPLPGGDHSIQAVYGGSGNYTTSSSPVLFQTVSRLSPVVSTTSSINPVKNGELVTFTAHVSSTDGTPQGTVDFLDGTTTLQTVPLQAGQAGYTTSSLSSGAHSITAKYSGDSNFESVISPALNQSVIFTTQTALAPSVNPSTPGQNVVFTATVTSTGGTPDGGIDFIVDSKVAVTGVALQNGQATYHTDQLAEGNHIVTAIYKFNAGSNFAGSTSPTLTQTVLNQTTTVVSSNANPAVPGIPVTFQATITTTNGAPTGTVDFLDGATVLANRVPASHGNASYTTSTLQTGSHSITATYRPDANTSFSGSTSQPLVQVILATTTTVVTSSVNPSIHGQSVTLTATVTGAGGTPTGTVTFSEGGTTLAQAPLSSGTASFSTATLTQGTHAIVASYSGDSNFSANKSPTFTQTTNLTTPSVTISSSQNPSTQGQSVTFTATVTGPAGTTPTGTVVFLDGGHALGSGSISGATAGYSVSVLSAGAHSITAAYQGDGNFSGSSSVPLNQQVQAQCVPATVSVSANPSPATIGQPVIFSATVTWSNGGAPVGNVTISESLDNNDVRIWGTANLQANGMATIPVQGLPLGAHRMYATYGGDLPSNHCGATSESLSLTVNAAMSQ